MNVRGLRVPLTIEQVVVVGAEGNGQLEVDFAPLMCIGRSFESVNFQSPQPFEKSNQFLRFGFCNHELRPLLQLATSEGTFEGHSPQTLPAGTHHFCVQLRNDKSFRVFWNGHPLFDGKFRGVFVEHNAEVIHIGHGGGFLTLYSKVYSGLMDPERLFARKAGLPRDITGWNEREQSFDAISPSTSVDYWHVSKVLLWMSRRVSPLARQILELDGTSLTSADEPEETATKALTRVSNLANELESIIQRTTATERADLLPFFKENPGGIVFVEPLAKVVRREVLLQNFGQIDFVVERADRRFSVIEIEGHGRPIFKANNEFTEIVNHAILQVRNWIAGVSRSPDVISRLFGSVPFEAFSGKVVIGLRGDMCNVDRTRLWHDEQRVELLNWNDVLDYARQIERLLGDPVVRGISWAD